MTAYGSGVVESASAGERPTAPSYLFMYFEISTGRSKASTFDLKVQTRNGFPFGGPQDLRTPDPEKPDGLGGIFKVTSFFGGRGGGLGKPRYVPCCEEGAALRWPLELCYLSTKRGRLDGAACGGAGQPTGAVGK